MDFLSSDDEVLISASILCCKLLLSQSQGKKKKRTYKTRPINRSRFTEGFYRTYFLPMKMCDEEQFFVYTRLSVQSFVKLLEMITPHIIKRKLPDEISPEERLAITLHYFSQGSTMQTIAWKYHMGHSTISAIIKETAVAIWEVLSNVYLKPPSCQDEWLNISGSFEEQWNFPNCIGALDGKHIQIQAPKKSGSQFFNYKKTFSIILLACCDANYNFLLVDVGAYGSESDGGVFSNSVFGSMIEQNELCIPPPQYLSNSQILHPFSVVADAAFPLKPYIMRPYPGHNLEPSKRIFNYRLSRARRVIENAFGILVNRWRLLRNMMAADIDNIDSFVKAILCLHNYAKKEAEKRSSLLYCPTDFVDSEDKSGKWRDDVTPLQSVGRMSANRASQISYRLRDNLKEYFMSPAGAVPWQDKVLSDGADFVIN